MITLVELCMIVVFLLLVHEVILSRYTHKLKSDIEQQHLLAHTYGPNGSPLTPDTKQPSDSSPSILISASHKITTIWSNQHKVRLDTLPDDIIFQILGNLNQFDVVNLCQVNTRMYWYGMHRLFRNIVVYNYDGYYGNQMGISVQPGLHTKFYLDYTIINKPTFLKLLNQEGQQLQPKTPLVRNVILYFTDFSPQFKSSLVQTLPFAKVRMYQPYQSHLPYTYKYFHHNLGYLDVDGHGLSDLTELSLTFESVFDMETNRLIVDSLITVYGQLKSVRLVNITTEILQYFKSLDVQFNKVKSLSLNFDIRQCQNLDLLNALFDLNQIQEFEIFLNKSFNVVGIDQLQLYRLNQKLINVKSVNFTTHCQLPYFDYFSSFTSNKISRLSINLKYKNASHHLTSEVLFNCGILNLFPLLEILKFNNQLFQHDNFNQKEKYTLNSMNVFFKPQINNATVMFADYMNHIYKSHLKYLVINDLQYAIETSFDEVINVTPIT